VVAPRVVIVDELGQARFKLGPEKSADGGTKISKELREIARVNILPGKLVEEPGIVALRE